MITASYFTSKSPGRIAISLGVPKGFEELPRYLALAPTSAILHIEDEEQYERRYLAMIRKLDARQVEADLRALVPGHEPVLCCWEKPPFTETNWCHRRMAAAFLESRLGIRVPEFEPPPPEPSRQLGMFGGAR